MASDTFSEVGWFEWQVPNNVVEVQVDLRGGGSGGREGGRVLGVVAVRPNDILMIRVGEEGKPAVGKAGGATAEGGGGHGGDATETPGFGTARGGDGGGGATHIRRGTQWGEIVAVAGGAGGRSGQGALGGLGGANTGGSGQEQFGSSVVDVPTGGTQSGPGQPGVNREKATFSGDRGNNANIGLGGRGGQQTGFGESHGGGGGGGGWYPGSGGTASSPVFGYPSTGGSGGSNYIGGLYNAVSYRGAGSLGRGLVVLNFSGSVRENLEPTPPTDVLINGIAEEENLATRSQFTPVTVEAEISDPNNRDLVRMLARVTADPTFGTFTDVYTGFASAGERVTITLTGLSPNTRYYARLYSQDDLGAYSVEYNSINFWTNRPPNPPELLTPAENAAIPVLPELATYVSFVWKRTDPDDRDDNADHSTGFRIRFRIAATATNAASAWQTIDYSNSPLVTSIQIANSVRLFTGNSIYEWEVQTRDEQMVWGEWSLPSSFYALGGTAAPDPVAPVRHEAVEINKPVIFRWRFTDPTPVDYQVRADLRYRISGQGEEGWVTLFGGEEIVGYVEDKDVYYDANGNASTGIPGKDQEWTLPANTFDPTFLYEWQVRTYDQNRDTSDWSHSSFFWTVALTEAPPLPSLTGPALGSLGCGEHRVFVYQRGGRVLIGEITPVATLTYGYVRDDIANCIVDTNGFGYDCGQLLGDLRCWMHEIVVYRDGVRVWEGPITRLTYQQNAVEVEAKDCMAYVYRRIMRQGYNDSYHCIDGKEPGCVGGKVYGLTTVVRRARQIIMNALAPADDNLLPYLTALEYDNDAKQSRVVADYTKTAWEEVDDLAATAGLDYTTIGRRIILWDTHRPLGRLPELRDKDFSSPPIVTEYGMQLSNYYAVTNNNGVWGASQEPNGFEPYGPIELLSSAYGETDTGSGDVLTPQAKAELVKVLESQAQRGRQDRWPTPVVVRVPDNSAMSPDAPVTLQQLVPGVWIPLRATGTVREVAQWQKLDSVTVVVGAGTESVQVVMSPAPNAGQDPDSEETAAEGEGG